jgi:hypothetical protein
MFKTGDSVEYQNAIGERVPGIVISVTEEEVTVQLEIGIPRVSMVFTDDGREVPGEPITLFHR